MDIEKLVIKNMGLVGFVAKRYRNCGEWEDLYQMASIGLVKAAKGFKPELGYEFSTYAVSKIDGELKRYVRDNNFNSFKIQRHVKMLYLKYVRLNGLGKTDAEICEELNTTQEKLDYAISAMSLNTSFEYELDEFGHTTKDTAPDPFNLENEVLQHVELQERLALLKTMVPKRSYEILLLRLQAKSQSEIGQKVKLTQTEVSRSLARINKAIKSMATKYNKAV